MSKNVANFQTQTFKELQKPRGTITEDHFKKNIRNCSSFEAKYKEIDGSRLLSNTLAQCRWLFNYLLFCKSLFFMSM